MPKLKKLSLNSDVLTERQKKAVRGGWLQTPDPCCGGDCDRRCGRKDKSDEAQYEALN